jgi:hypothetical protein
MLPKEVFLSHSDQDRKFATALAKVLERHGIKVWYSRTHLAGSAEWFDEIGKALNRCNWFLIVLSPHSLKSNWVKYELVSALTNKRYEGRIVSVLYKPCKWKKRYWALASFQLKDFTKKLADGYRELLKVWGVAYKSK